MDTVPEKSNLPPLDRNQQERLQDQEADGLTPHKTKSSRSGRSPNSPRSTSSKRKARTQHSGSTKLNDNYSVENKSEDGILIVEPSNAVLSIKPSDVILKIENLESAEDKNSKRRKRSPRKENPAPANSGILDEEKQEHSSEYNDHEPDNESGFHFDAQGKNQEEEEVELDENGNPIRKGFRERAPSPLELSQSRQEPIKSPKLCTLGVELNSLSDSQAPQDPEHSHDHLTNVLTPKSARSIKRPKSTRSKKGSTPRNAKSLRARSNRAARSIEDENGSKSPKRRQKSPKNVQQRSLEDGILIVEPSNGVMEIEPSDILKIQTEKQNAKQQEIDLEALQGCDLDSDTLDDLVRKNGEQNFSSSTIAAFDSDEDVVREKVKTTITEEEIIQSRDFQSKSKEEAEELEKRYREEEEELREKQLETLRKIATWVNDPSAASHRAESRQSRMSRMSRKSRQARDPEGVAKELAEQDNQKFVLADTPQTLEAITPVEVAPQEASAGELQSAAQGAVANLVE